ncbi:hypothetical protein [uncultured Flavonifractor sp.]|uniref:hypothetical protein n=1 Tax=uncultured Flavonifractor sp. TaxID=1193534 RepID=UPI00260B2B84|nr:hypothetical protein [uncultured Flavonifractor sp.]
MKTLIATRPILYQGRMIQSGDRLPADEQKMVEAWLRAGSACWVGDVTAADTGGEAAPDGAVIPDALDIVDGHFTVDSLMTLTRESMEDLVQDLGLDSAKCKNKSELAQLLAAVELEAASEEEDPAT